MKKIKFIITFILEFIVFFYELIFFKLFKKKGSSRGLHFLIKFHCLTNGVGTDLINLIIKNKKKTKFKFYNEDPFVNIKDDKSQIIKTLNKDGYYSFEDAISITTVNSIKKSLINLTGQYSSDNYKSSENEKLKDYNYKEKLDISNPKAVKFQYSSNDLIDIPEIQKILSNEKIVSLAQDYLDSTPILDLVEAWWSFPGQFADSEAAQQWHFDMDRAKWIKIFFYLTECNDHNGPHFFVNKTHRSKSIPYHIRKLGYSRIDDDTVKAHFQSNQISKFVGKEGMMFFEDTKGLHKGSQVISGNRLVLQFQFSSSLFPGEVEYLSFPKKQNSSFLSLLNKNPAIFSKFK